MEEKRCAECDKPVFGRMDKKFCSDSCRNAYNNRSNATTTKYMRKVNNVLARNRRILLEMNPTGKKKTHKDKLLKAGFDFDYYTNSYATKAGDIYRFCYEQGYLLLDEGFVLLVENNKNG